MECAMVTRFRFAGIALLAFLLLVLSASAASATDSGSAEAQFVSRLNGVRAGRGLPALAVDGHLTSVARSWSAKMASDGAISHNPSLGSQVSGWRTLGENVGTGSSVDSIEQAFENSPHHYENMVDANYTLVGIGVVVDGNGTIWVTEDFEQPASSPRPAPAPAPARPAPPAPKPVARQVARPAPRPAPAPRPVQPAAAAPVAPPTTAQSAPPTTPPITVLGNFTSRRPAGGQGIAVRNPFTAANRAGLVAVVVLGAAMALFSRYRVTNPAR
jgi:cysteine-rich secretory family protein